MPPLEHQVPGDHDQQGRQHGQHRQQWERHAAPSLCSQERLRRRNVPLSTAFKTVRSRPRGPGEAGAREKDPEPLE